MPTKFELGNARRLAPNTPTLRETLHVSDTVLKEESLEHMGVESTTDWFFIATKDSYTLVKPSGYDRVLRRGLKAEVEDHRKLGEEVVGSHGGYREIYPSLDPSLGTAASAPTATPDLDLLACVQKAFDRYVKSSATNRNNQSLSKVATEHQEGLSDSAGVGGQNSGSPTAYIDFPSSIPEGMTPTLGDVGLGRTHSRPRSGRSSGFRRGASRRSGRGLGRSGRSMSSTSIDQPVSSVERGSNNTQSRRFSISHRSRGSLRGRNPTRTTCANPDSVSQDPPV